MGRYGEGKARYRSENAQPSAPSLKGEPQRRTEEACEQCVSTEPEKCVPGTELEAIRGHANLGVNVDYIKRCLVPGEAEAHQGTADKAIAHIVELRPQQPKKQ